MFSVRWARFLSVGRESGVSPAFYFSRLPVLETDRLILRPVRRQDAKDIFAYASDPEVARYVLWEPHRSLTETRNYVRCMRSLYRRGLPSSWAAAENFPLNSQ